ncbi:uncharacterized protein Tco025E_05978 [Trypanosoma conorhini]|uniref:Uncharacterized protein n=1 Tax=Trypanosoma conorhini TaxID=83891 RepID=A0A3R7RVS9_9TRYP|nr:uncharacterized protein Tco025E_05978 [Trypanosoma conorhini]RNF14021.1 hypothetical protein Tco025E_05978 [Trypanosoma conorhini]
MRRCCCDAVIAELLRRVPHRRQRGGRSHEEAKKRSPVDGLTTSLLCIAASTAGGAAAAQAACDASPPRVDRHAKDPQRVVSALAAASQGAAAPQTPRILRALLLKSRRESAGTHQDAGRAPPACPMAESAVGAGGGAGAAIAQMDEEVVATWYAAFQLFSEAVARHTVAPSIAHINVLLGITVRERRWRQMRQVEMFLDSILTSEAGGGEEEALRTLDAVADVRGPPQPAASLQPNSETYEWFMAAAVSRGHWEEALLCFDGAREACLPVSDGLLRLALEAYRLGGVHSIIGAAGSGHGRTLLVPLPTDHRGPFLHRMAAARPVSGSPAVRRETAAPEHLWEAALLLFSSFLHRVRERETVLLFMSMMAAAGRHLAVLDAYRDCSRTVDLGDGVLPLLSTAAREVGDWALSLRLLRHLAAAQPEAQGTKLGRRVLEDALLVLRRSQQYAKMLWLHLSLPAGMWTARGRVMVAQAAMVQRDLPLLLQLLEAAEAKGLPGRAEDDDDDDDVAAVLCHPLRHPAASAASAVVPERCTTSCCAAFSWSSFTAALTSRHRDITPCKISHRFPWRFTRGFSRAHGGSFPGLRMPHVGPRSPCMRRC